MAKVSKFRSPINGAVLPEGKRFEPGEKAREMARKGGKKSGEVRAKRATLREELRFALQQTIEYEGQQVKASEAVAAAIVARAVTGDAKAFIALRDTLGERPTETLEVTNHIDNSGYAALDAAFAQLALEVFEDGRA